MATENVTILRVDTGEAVQSIADLKNNVKTYKKELENLEIGTEEYQDTLVKLKVSESALKNAMYATTSSMEDLAKAAKGTGESYNALVKQMADYKAELRNIDTSTDEGKQAFQELAAKINGVNDKLKEMDELQGNHSRNVGNYTSAFKNFDQTIANMPSTMNGFRGGLDNVNKSMKLLSTNPVMGVFALLAPLINGITSSLKENVTMTEALKKVMDALKPAMDLVGGAIQTVAEWVSKAVDYFVELATANTGTMRNIIAGAVGVGNVLLQYMLTPIRSVIAAFKGLGEVVKDVFTGKFAEAKEAASNALKGIGDAFKKGFDIKGNFEQGKKAGEQFVAGLQDASNRKQAKEAGQTIGNEVKEGVEEGLALIDWEKAFEQGERRLEKERRAREQEAKEFEEWLQDLEEEDQAYFDDMYDYYNAQMEEQFALEQERMKQRGELWQDYAGVTSSVLGSIADMMEASADGTAASEKRIKGIRIAAATIETIAGAVSAYMGAVKAYSAINPLGAQAIGAAQAAAVLASGMAQIAKIRNTDVSGGSSSASTASAGSTASYSAPTVSSSIPYTTVTTSASDEDRLNQMSSPQRVYILASDIEASGQARKVRVAESSF